MFGLFTLAVAAAVKTSLTQDWTQSELPAWVSVGSGKVLDLPVNPVAGSQTILYHRIPDLSSQKWELQNCADGPAYPCELVNTDTGMCLDATGSSCTNGVEVIVFPCHGGPNQKWHLYTDGKFMNSNCHSSCLDIPGSEYPNDWAG